VPGAPQPIALHDIVISDDLTASAANLVLVSFNRVSGSQSWTPVNTGTASSLVIEDTGNGIDIPPNEQIQIDITVRLANANPPNVAGLSFNNTASYRFNQINGNIGTQMNGGAGISNMTIVEPDTLIMDKSGPASVQFGLPSTFTLDVQNTGSCLGSDH